MPNLISQVTIPVNPLDDDLYEGDENIRASLLSSVNYTIGTNAESATKEAGRS